MAKRILERLKRIDRLIRLKATGKPSDFANRLELSESSMFGYLALMKSFGAPIKFDKFRNTYYYEYSGEFKIFFKKK